VGEPQAAAGALEELRARVALQLADLDRDRGRGEVQLLGGARDREVARGAFEDASWRRVAFFIPALYDHLTIPVNIFTFN
jgi:hypothetical protein